MAKMKLVTDDLDALAEAIARKIGWALIHGTTKDPNAGRCPNCGNGGFSDYCFHCRFVPFWEKKKEET
jgi:hypothetical protein